MVWNIEGIIWFLVLLDSIGANLAVWFFPGLARWYKRNYKWVYKYLPLTKGWAFAYLVLVLWVGSGLYRLGILSF
jgi:hypothetical protein